MAQKRYLDEVYDAAGRVDTETLYDAWADSYDDELTDNGYATPARVARAMAATGCKGPVLDIGCGTGLSGLQMRRAGFDMIDGTDLSEGMLAQARTKGVYRTLWTTDPDAALPVAPGDYATMAAVGVISPGAAGPELLDTLARALGPGGRLAFSFNDHALEDAGYTGRLDALQAQGFRTLFRDYGPHIPARDLGAMVYVLEKT